MTAFDFWLTIVVGFCWLVSVIGGLILRDRYKRREDERNEPIE